MVVSVGDDGKDVWIFDVPPATSLFDSPKYLFMIVDILRLMNVAPL